MNASPAKKISVTTATIIGMNAMIGAGIFSAPAALAQSVGPAAIVTYLLVIASVWCMAQSMARVAALFPEKGAFYTYTKQWAGHTGGLIASGFYLLGLIIAMGLLTQIAGAYLQFFIPHLSATTLGLIALSALTLLNMFGMALSELGQQVLIVCTVFPLIATTLLCLSKANIANITPFAPYGFGNVLDATRIVIFGFFGFECAASLFDIVEEPQKNVPRALTFSILAVGALYTLFVGSIILSTPLSLFSSPTMPVTAILAHLFPQSPWLVTIIGIAMISAVLGTVHSMIWASGHLLRELVGFLHSGWAKKLIASGYVNHRFAVLFLGCLIAATFFTLHNIDLFFNFTAIFLVLAFSMSIFTLLTIKEEWYSGQNIKTLLGMATAGLMVFFAVSNLLAEFSKLA